jgi:hypothetical protein
MATEPVRAVHLVRSWALLDSAFATTDAPRLWAEHWAMVVRLRRRYAGVAVALGLLLGGLSALNTVIFADLGAQWAPALVMLAVGLLLATYGRSIQGTYVAPFVFQNRHRLTVVYGALAYYLVVVVALFVEPRPSWMVVAGVLAALPWWVGARRELAAPRPDFPTEWTRFLID